MSGSLAAKIETRRTIGVLAGGRSERVVKRVLEASMVELAQSGYSAFRIDQVAAKAGVNKTTIYRRWPTKTEVVAATLKRIRDIFCVALPDTGNLETDLVGALRLKLTFKRRVEGRAWARMIAEKHIPEVAAIIRTAQREGTENWIHIVTRAIARGDVPKRTDAELLIDMVRVVIDERFRCSGGKLEDAVLVAVVRTVIAGAEAGTLVRGREVKTPRFNRRRPQL
jgi:AcrR family transcriptional regulator